MERLEEIAAEEACARGAAHRGTPAGLKFVDLAEGATEGVDLGCCRIFHSPLSLPSRSSKTVCRSARNSTSARWLTFGTPGGLFFECLLANFFAMEIFPGRDYSTAMEVLTAYVRQNTTQAPGLSEESSEAVSTSNEAAAEVDEEAKQPAPPEPSRPTADIQAILDVLGRAQASVPEEYHTRLNLQEANLRGANLQGAILTHARVTKEQLEDVESLQGATMPDGSKHS
jgi:hypothetical protein